MNFGIVLSILFKSIMFTFLDIFVFIVLLFRLSHDYSIPFFSGILNAKAFQSEIHSSANAFTPIFLGD